MSHCSTRLRIGSGSAAARSALPLPTPHYAVSTRSAASAHVAHAAATFAAPGPAADSSLGAFPMLSPADTFLSRYALGASLGRGTSGTVVSGFDKATGEAVAVKVVAKHWNAGRHQRSALHREAALWRRSCAATPQAGQFIAIEEDATNYYIVSEKCHGGSLQQLLESRGVLSEAELSQVAWCVLNFLTDMHRHSIYYGDLKPGNVILKDIYPCNSEPGCLNVRVVDFGCSQLVADGSHLRALAGSPLFLAPEIINGAYGLPADMWAFGVTMYMLICNRLPFWLEPISALEELDMDTINLSIRYNPVLFAGAQWRGVSEDLKDLICSVLEKDPERRLTARQAMQHPWFTNARDMCVV